MTRNETLFALPDKNVRLLVKLFGELRAPLAVCHTGAPARRCPHMRSRVASIAQPVFAHGFASDR